LRIEFGLSVEAQRQLAVIGVAPETVVGLVGELV
jgi:hypothetical protein